MRQGLAGPQPGHDARGQRRGQHGAGGEGDAGLAPRAARCRFAGVMGQGGASHTRPFMAGSVEEGDDEDAPGVVRERAPSHVCSMAKNTGTSTRVATVPQARPPITVRPSGAFWAPAPPEPRAIGTMPNSMASAVMTTGRNRPTPAANAASSGGFPSASTSRARLTTRMLLVVAMQTHMMAPVSAGTLMVVSVANSIHAMPASAAGSWPMMASGSVQPVLDIFGAVRGRDLGAVAADITRITDGARKTLPPGSDLVLRGQVQTMQTSFAGLLAGLAGAIVLVYLLMVVNFQSWLGVDHIQGREAARLQCVRVEVHHHLAYLATIRQRNRRALHGGQLRADKAVAQVVELLFGQLVAAKREPQDGYRGRAVAQYQRWRGAWRHAAQHRLRAGRGCAMARLISAPGWKNTLMTATLASVCDSICSMSSTLLVSDRS